MHETKSAKLLTNEREYRDWQWRRYTCTRGLMGGDWQSRFQNDACSTNRSRKDWTMGSSLAWYKCYKHMHTYSYMLRVHVAWWLTPCTVKWRPYQIARAKCTTRTVRRQLTSHRTYAYTYNISVEYHRNWRGGGRGDVTTCKWNMAARE